MPLTAVYKDMAIILAEIVLLIALFLALNVTIKFFYNRVTRFSFLNRFQNRIDTIHHNIKGVLIFICAGLCVAVVAWNGYALYQGVHLFEYTIKQFDQIDPSIWWEIGFGLLKIIILIISATLTIRLLGRMLLFLQEKAKTYEQIKANDESIEIFFSFLSRMLTVSIWLFVLVLAARTLFFPGTVSKYLFVALKIYIIVSLGMLVVKAIDALVDSLDALSKKYASPDNVLRFYDQLRGLIPLLRRCLEYVIYVLVASLVTSQIDFIAQFSEYGTRIAEVIGIFFLSRVFVEVVYLLVDEAQPKTKSLPPEEQQSRLTLIPIIKSSLKYGIYFGAFVFMLKALGINPTPILAGAGILGLVVGLGAQSLINDIISGLFVLFENLYRVGDYIETESARGIVESIDIRTTRIRDPNGQQHILRNGQIGRIVNYSKGYTYAVVEVGVAYSSDLNHVYRVLSETGKEFQKKFEDVLEPTIVQGLENFGESGMLIRCVTKVRPGRHLQMARDFRKFVKEAFSREGIEIPTTPRVVLFKQDLQE